MMTSRNSQGQAGYPSCHHGARRFRVWGYRSRDDDDDDVGRIQPDDSLLMELKLARGDGVAELLLTVARAARSGVAAVVVVVVRRVSRQDEYTCRQKCADIV